MNKNIQGDFQICISVPLRKPKHVIPFMTGAVIILKPVHYMITVSVMKGLNEKNHNDCN